MNILRLFKMFVFGATGLFIVITLFSLLIPSRVRVSRITVINDVTPGRVYNEVSNFGRWKNWHPVFKSDSTTIAFTDSSKRSCDVSYNNSVAHLSITFLEATSIKFDLFSNSQNDIHNEITLTNLTGSHSVQVEWLASIKLRWYPWEKFYGIFIDKLSGPGYEAALNGLKSFLEKK